MPMSKLKKDTQKLLLDQLSDLGFGQSEWEDQTHFAANLLPITQHLRSFDPDVVLVVGDRGTGKSALFGAVFKNNLLPELGPFVTELRLPYQDTEHIKWLPGYPLSGSQFPDQRGLRDVINSPEKGVETWFAYLVRVLQSELHDASLKELFQIPGGDPDSVLETFNKLGNKPLLALDSLDQKLEKENSWVFIGYDGLDTLGGYDLEAMTNAVRGLIAFWSSYTRRWQRIRAKVFLRSDLFRRHAGLGGADLAKLAANRVELPWNNKNLFAMLIKRIANKSKELHEYCKAARIPFRKESATFGHIPDLNRPEDAQPLIEKLIGKYMGANERKGKSFNWVLDHLRDGKKCVTPRLLVRLFEQAAIKERDNPRASSPNLFRPVSMRQALDDVSTDHVLQAISSEWPWMDGIKHRIEKNKLVPWTRTELQKLLEENWDASWSTNKPNSRPPAPGSRELIDYLIELGIFRERSTDRIDVPDIYLSGLGLKRKGGVIRK